MKLVYRTKAVATAISNYYGKPLDRPDWYKINNISDDEAEVFLYDYIGWPYNDAGDFVRLIAEMNQSKIVIRINSPGGDVWDANAIFNAIQSHKSKPVTRIESLAASAASYIALAGREVQAYKNTMMMIHEPMIFVFGMFNQYDIEELNTDAKSILSMISNNMVDMYADNGNIGKKEIKEMLKAETWLTSKKAKEKGFIDTIIDGKAREKAAFNLSIFSELPDEIKSNLSDDLTIRDAEKALRDAGFSQAISKAVLSRGWGGVDDSYQRDVDDLNATIINGAKELIKTLTV